MVESRWFRRAGPGIAAIGAIGAIALVASTTSGADRRHLDAADELGQVQVFALVPRVQKQLSDEHVFARLHRVGGDAGQAQQGRYRYVDPLGDLFALRVRRVRGHRHGSNRLLRPASLPGV